jgi:hypothetical protein
MNRPTARLAGRAALLAIGALGTGAAFAFEYPLQFTPPGNYKDLVIVGLQFAGDSVVGNCSYTQITSGSGRDPKTIYTPIPQTCTWDLVGTLLAVASGAPLPQDPIETNGTETIFAMASPELYAGTDSALAQGGFVFNYGSHYDWLTSNAYMVLPQGRYTFTATLASNGDTPLTITSAKASTAVKQTKASIGSTTCIGVIPVGGTCDVTVTYSDGRLSSTTGLAYDTLTLHLTSDAARTKDFVQSYTIEVRTPR